MVITDHFYMVKVLKAQDKIEEAKLEMDRTIVLSQKGYVLHDLYVCLDDKFIGA
ncbi:hypothetical protein QYS49_12985 [Marivirga salinae]|uniref:Uncharacterized protein n=1 Tax=Marivirga salinarum TaxID=3059078 RepID=A0AA49JH37_9BACT|nr:hypothetical protein [Marivirga sp. BDSF4-3]WKK77904.2 hypothetical protein QYS49_12985 [Marivirga sp. BDSF4-3]